MKNSGPTFFLVMNLGWNYTDKAILRIEDTELKIGRILLAHKLQNSTSKCWLLGDLGQVVYKSCISFRRVKKLLQLTIKTIYSQCTLKPWKVIFFQAKKVLYFNKMGLLHILRNLQLRFWKIKFEQSGERVYGLEIALI